MTNCQGAAFCQNQSRIPIREVISIDTTRTCYRVPFNQYEMRNSHEQFIVTANSYSLPNRLLWDSEREIIIYFSNSNTTVSYELTLSSEKSIFTYFNWHMYVNVAISAVHRSLRSLNRCSEYKTREICIIECRVQLISQMCNCTPTKWSSWAKSDMYEECKLRDYINCVNYSGTEDKICVETNCSSNMELCERSSYTLTKDPGRSDYEAKIVIKVINFDYPIFQEQYKLTFEEFTAALGGAIGFYLSIDFLIIVTFIIKVISILWKMLIRRFYSTEQ